MSDDIVFDNFIIADSKSMADSWAADTWEVKRLQELSSGSSGVSIHAYLYCIYLLRLSSDP